MVNGKNAEKRIDSGRGIRRFACLLCLGLLLALCCSCGKGALSLRELVIETPPTKTVYGEGETFDRSGMTVCAVYSDGSRTSIGTYSVSPQVLTAAQTFVTVSYQGKSATVPVTVNAIPVTDLRIIAQPEKTVYRDGEAFDPAGMEIVGVRENGTEVPVTEYSVSPKTLSVTDREVTVTWGDCTVKVPVRVLAAESDMRLTLAAEPIRRVYLAGECFDVTGVVLMAQTERNGTVERTYTAPDDYQKTPLEEGAKSTWVSLLGVEVSIPVTVIPGTAASFHSVYDEQTYREKLNEFSGMGQLLKDTDGERFLAVRQIDDPAPDGIVGDFPTLVKAVDRAIFYRVPRLVVRLDYAVSSLSEEIARLYYRSDILASVAAADGEAIGDGWVQILFRYYEGSLLLPDTGTAIRSRYLTADRGEETRSERTFPLIDRENGVSVYTSEQAVYALCHGYRVSPIEDSPAQKILSAATEILCAYCDDGMTEFEKMYRLYLYFVDHVIYDNVGEEWAGHCLDCARESDMLSAKLLSFRAEGGLIYGTSTCFGYAKAYAVLLALEGMDVRRVVGRSEGTAEGTAFAVDPETGAYIPAFTDHSYLYVRLDGKDYLLDATFAYAGSVSVKGNGDAVWYRTFGLGLTKEQHQQVYSIISDAYSDSADYCPASFEYLQRITYDGQHECLLKSENEVKAYFAALSPLAKKAAADGYGAVAFNVTIADSCGSDETLNRWITQQTSALAGDGGAYCRGFEKRTFGGEDYLSFLLVVCQGK